MHPRLPNNRESALSMSCGERGWAGKALTGKAISDYHMIQDGEHLLVGVSGGVDSMVLMQVLKRLQKRAPITFGLSAVTIDEGFDDKDLSPLASYADAQKWNLKIIHPQTLKLAASERVFYEIQKLGHAGVPESQIQSLVEILETLEEMNMDLNIWKSQNYYFSLLKGFHKGKQPIVNDDWKNTFLRLGELLNIRPLAIESVSAKQVTI